MIELGQRAAVSVPFEQARARFAEIRQQGKRIVQCHGTFDLIHPGHIVHFEEAKALGDVLVVTLTGQRYVSKGPGRPYFNDEMRLRWLAALRPVDYVVLVPYPAAAEAIEAVRPDVYCKGREYADLRNDVTGNIADDVSTVARMGGEVRYVGSVVFSSSRLLNQHFEAYPHDVKAFCARVARTCTAAEFRSLVDSFVNLRVLVVGDIIFDRYTTLQVQGLTSKNRILSGRFVNEELQAGGALAVFRHLRGFADHVRLISLTGDEPWVDAALGGFIRPEERALVSSPAFTTVVKERFVEPHSEGKQLSKLFSVNFLDRSEPDPRLQDAVLRRVKEHIDHCDLVVVMDFGHGVMTSRVRELIQERAPFLAVNCQTNSNNHGFNIINRRYTRAESFSLDEMEMTLAMGRRELDYGSDLTSLAAQLRSDYGWLTRGGVETLGYQKTDGIINCPPFEQSVVDTIGAGDAFCALASLAAVARVPLEIATFMGQLAGAQAVKIIGNAEPISKSRLLKGAASMLAY